MCKGGEFCSFKKIKEVYVQFEPRWEVSVISVKLKEGQFNFLVFKSVTLLEQILGN